MQILLCFFILFINFEETNLNMFIGSNLRKLRNKTKYSQQNVEDFLEISRLTYANWENETTDVKAQYIPKLAEIFEVSISELFRDELSFESTTYIPLRHGIFINIPDSETAKQLANQISNLLQSKKSHS